MLRCDALGHEHVLFGSDYPHPEGLREPRDYVQQLYAPAAQASRGLAASSYAPAREVASWRAEVVRAALA